MILEPNRNAWRIERAERAAVLVDAGRFFGAVRETLLQARSTVFILGWDIDSRMRLVGESGRAEDGLPEELVAFLSALVKRRPQLLVHLLVWDYSVLYSLERELFPVMSLHWGTPRHIRFCLDDDLPLGASHHQKIVVVDDSVAFCGGLDLTARRWDTAEHQLSDPRRVDPAGLPYPPFHDVQAVVDGKAARALAELARARWARAACERAPPVRPLHAPWPQTVSPDLTGIDVGIARTLPAVDEAERDIREVEALFFDCISRAERTVYIENQFLTATRIAEHLAKRMRERPRLEAVLVAPKTAHSWIEGQTMRAGMGRFMQVFSDAGVDARVRLLHPRVVEGDIAGDTLVHSKVMVIDDVLLRVGSANLNNRSFGLDAECDLAFEAKDADHRAAIRRIRDRLLGHHCGVGGDVVAANLARTGSLIATAQSLRDGTHSLEPIDLSNNHSLWLGLEGVADPERPIGAPAFLEGFVGRRPPARRIGRVAKLITLALAIVAIVLAWRFTALSNLLEPEAIRNALARIAGLPGAPLIVVTVFVVGGLLVFPVMLLIAATAAAFGPWLGFTYAAAGAMASAIVTYGAGALIGREPLEDLLGPRLNRIRRSIVERGGFLAIAAVRMVPVAPFTVVNLVAGASRIRFLDYVLGTFIGMAPGLIVMSALGHQIFSLMTEPTLVNLALAVLAVFGWVALSIGIQALLIRSRRLKI